MSAALSSKLRAATIARALPIAADAAVQRVAPTVRPEETGTVIIVRDLDREIDLVTIVPHAAWMRAVRRKGLPPSFALRPHEGTRCMLVIEGQVHEARLHGTGAPTLATVHALNAHPRYRPPTPTEPPKTAPTPSKGRALTLAAHTLYRAWLAMCSASHDDASGQLATDAGHLLDRAWVLAHAALDEEKNK